MICGCVQPTRWLPTKPNIEECLNEIRNAGRGAGSRAAGVKKYRVTIWRPRWPGMPPINRHRYVGDVESALRIKRKECEATICVWAGQKNGWQIATENGEL